MVTRAEWENGFKEGRRHADRNVSRVITAELNEYCLCCIATTLLVMPPTRRVPEALCFRVVRPSVRESR